MAAMFSKAGSLCYLAQFIYLIFYQTLNFSTTWVIPTFALQGKLNSRSRNTPYRPTTTRLKHGFMCVFLLRKDLTIFMDIELNPGPYHLGSSSFQLNRALLILLFPSIPQKGSGLVSIGKSARYVYTRDDLINIPQMGTCKLSNWAFLNVKSNGTLRCHGTWSGKAVKTRLTWLHWSVNITQSWKRSTTTSRPWNCDG